MAELVLYTRADAARAAARKPPEVSAVLGLTPNARAAAAGLGLPMIDPMTRYGDVRQARDVARVVRVRRRMLKALGPISAVERELLIDQFNRVAYSALRLWHTLGETGPWLVPAESGSFALISAREAAHGCLLAHILDPKVAAETEAAAIRTPPLPALYRALRRLALWRHPSSDVRLALGMAKEQFGLFEAFARQGKAARTLFVGLPQRGAWEYVKLAREALRNLRAKGLVQVSLAPSRAGTDGGLAARAADAVADRAISPAFARYVPLVAAKLGYLASARLDARRVFAQARPHAFTAAEISTFGNWIVAEAAGEAGVPRMVMSRNAHTAPDRPLARDSAIGYLRARYPRDLVDQPLFWSPAGARAGECARRPGEWPRIRPLVARRPAQGSRPPRAAPSVERVVLLADTYAAWWFPHSWIFLTGDEFVAAARELAAAIAPLAHTRLVIRAKKKPKCDLAALTALVDPKGNCAINTREVPFEEDLARADLLVAFHSTTIEETLIARKPVLLWGGTARHEYLAAREVRPTAQDRGAVYGVRRPGALGPMIAAVLDAHHGRPLSDDEAAPYAWPRDTMNVGDLAVEIVNRASAGVPPREKEASLAAR